MGATASAESKKTPSPVTSQHISLENRPSASFKIKDALKKINQAEPVVLQKKAETAPETVEAREAFDEAAVVKALEQYITGHSLEPTIAIALKSHRPDVRDEAVVLYVDNQLQLDKLEGLKAHLLLALRRSLKNGTLSLNFQMFDDGNSKEEKKLFTASEKFEHFLKLNPVVADLKVVFGLELE